MIREFTLLRLKSNSILNFLSDLTLSCHGGLSWFIKHITIIFLIIYILYYEFRRYSNSFKQKFYEFTGCPVIVNTLFNIRGEPIVCNPEDTFKCFMGTNLDILVCENFILLKDKQNKNLSQNYLNKFEKD